MQFRQAPSSEVVHLGSGMQAPEGCRRKWLGVGATAHFKNIACGDGLYRFMGNLYEFIWIYMDLPHDSLWCYQTWQSEIPSKVYRQVGKSTNYCWWRFQQTMDDTRV